jgi:ABC-2 type transport system ATP-binding protein
MEHRTDGHAIEVEALRKVYAGGVEALKGIDLAVEPGEVFSLLGPNGAGKSTTIGVLTSTVAPTSGSARLAGYDVVSEPLSARSISSVLFQDPVVDRPLSGRRNLELHARLWGLPAARATERLKQIVDAFDLAPLIERGVGTYSGGERRRLEIARALVSEPRVLFLDEPTVGLDPRIRFELLDVIGRLRERSEMAILLTTHYLDEAERLSDLIAIMRAGRIVAMGTPTELVSSLGSELVELRLESDAASALAALRAGGIVNGDAFSIGSTLILPALDRTVEGIMAGVEARGFSTISMVSRRPTLDDVYLRSTGDALEDAA